MSGTNAPGTMAAVRGPEYDPMWDAHQRYLRAHEHYVLGVLAALLVVAAILVWRVRRWSFRIAIAVLFALLAVTFACVEMQRVF